MNILEALKQTDINIRLISRDENRWMFWDSEAQTWIVRESRPGHRVVLINTPSEEAAVKVLLEGRE